MTKEELLEISLSFGLSSLLTFRGFCLNINFSFLENNKSYKESARNFYERFTEISRNLLLLADGNVSESFLKSDSITNEYTLPLLRLTEKLFNINISTELAEQILSLTPGKPKNVSDDVIEKINLINQVSLLIAVNFVDFLKDIFRKETTNNLYSYSYPFLIRKMIEDVELYIYILERLVKNMKLDPTFAVDNEFKSIELTKAFGKFIRSFVDPSRNDIIIRAQSFIIETDNLLTEYKNTTFSPDNQKALTIKGKDLIERFLVFIKSIASDLLSADVYLIVEPLFLDNIIRTLSLYKAFIFTVNLSIES